MLLIGALHYLLHEVGQAEARYSQVLPVNLLYLGSVFQKMLIKNITSCTLLPDEHGSMILFHTFVQRSVVT